MHQFLKSVLFFAFFGYVSVAVAQLDNPNGKTTGGKIIGILNTPASVKEVKKPKSLEFSNDNGFKTANQKLRQEQKLKQKEQDLQNKGIITSEMIAKQNFKKNVEGKFTNFPMIDMDLGSFHTKSDVFYISSYDFGRFDGDRVQISVNGKRIHNNYLLTPKIKTLKIPLEIGINKIEVTALNEGKFLPNTGFFAFFDNNRNVVKEGEWMLATGAKVIAIVVRDE